MNEADAWGVADQMTDNEDPPPEPRRRWDIVQPPQSQPDVGPRVSMRVFITIVVVLAAVWLVWWLVHRPA